MSIDFAKYLAAGLSVIPIVTGGSKAPAVGSWKQYQTEPAGPEAEHWARQHKGIGIVCGYGDLEVLDIDAPELVDLILQDVPKRLIDHLCLVETPRQDQQGNRGLHIYYRCRKISGNTKLAMGLDREGKEITLIETRGRGGYVVTCGSSPECHETGRTYDWLAGPDLTAIEYIEPEDRELLHNLARRFDRLGPVSCHIELPGTGRRPGDEYERSVTWESILWPHGWTAVRQSGEVTYWRRPGKDRGWSATTGMRSQAGRELLCVFSSNASPFSGPDGSRACSSYGKFAAYTMLNHGGDFSEASRQLASQGFGQANSSDVDLTHVIRQAENEPKSQRVKTQRAGKFPEECLLPEGLIGDIVRHTLQTALYPQPELALGAAISLMSVVTGRKVTDRVGTRTNLYVLALDVSGAGKEHARRITKEILHQAGAPEKMIGSERVGSHAGLVSAIADCPAVLMQLDEIGRLLATMKNPKQSPHLYNIATVLMAVFSSSNTIWKSDALADSKRTRVVDQPHLVIYGTGTPDALWDNLTEENIGEGLVGRLIVFEGRGYKVKPQDGEPRKVPDAILEPVRWWLGYSGAGGNLNNEHPQPAVIPHTEEAATRLKQHRTAILDRRAYESEVRAAVWSRSIEKAAKLALLAACSRSRVLPAAITVEDAEWAIRLSNWLTRRMLEQCFDRVAGTETEAARKRILRIVGDRRLTLTELTRRTQWLRARERKEYLAELIEIGDLQTAQEGTNGRTKTVVFRSMNSGEYA